MMMMMMMMIIVIITITIIILIAHNVTEVAHDCVVALKNWFEGRGIKNSFDTWHGKFQMDKPLMFVWRSIIINLPLSSLVGALINVLFYNYNNVVSCSLGLVDFATNTSFTPWGQSSWNVTVVQCSATFMNFIVKNNKGQWRRSVLIWKGLLNRGFDITYKYLIIFSLNINFSCFDRYKRSCAWYEKNM